MPRAWLALADSDLRQPGNIADGELEEEALAGFVAGAQRLGLAALQSGDDFYHAAFLLQHGAAPDDYLKAHLLAMVAIARGKPGATWIASATLDRYLQSIGKPQLLGTQFSLSPNTAASQEPYNRALVPDAMRKALRVPSIAEQEKQRLEMEQQSSMTKKTSN